MTAVDWESFVMKRSSLMTLTIGLLLFPLFAASDSVRAQQSDRQKPSVTINTDLVVTWAQITSRGDGTPVKGLEIDNFLLREDGKPQQISLIKEDQPLSVVILVQGLIPCGESFSIMTSFRRNREALRQLGDDAEIALMVWYSRVALVQPMTRDWINIAYYLEDRNRLIKASNQAGLVDSIPELERPGEAIYQAARYLEKATPPGRRKVIIIINEPNWVSQKHLHTATEVSELIEKTGTTVYWLYQTFDGRRRPEDDYSSSLLFGIKRQDKKRRAGGTIEEFAEQTGGSIITGDAKDSDELLIKLTGLIRSGYTIGYYPENSDFDGKFRRISLELSPQGKAKVGKVDIKTRNGYRALRPSTPIGSEAQPER